MKPATKVMRLVRRGKQHRHMGLLKTDEALKGYQQAYDAMVTRYAITPVESWWRKLWRKLS